MVPIIAWLVADYGWRSAAFILGMGMAVVGLPMAVLVRHRPEQYGYVPDGQSGPPAKAAGTDSEAGARANTPIEEVDFTIWEALKTRAFWILSLAFGFRTLAISATVIHQIPLLTDRGFSEGTAAGVLALMSLMSVPGRLIFGFLGDYLDKRRLVFIAYILQGIGLVVLLNASSLAHLYLFTIVFGLGWGAAYGAGGPARGLLRKAILRHHRRSAAVRCRRLAQSSARSTPAGSSTPRAATMQRF